MRRWPPLLAGAAWVVAACGAGGTPPTLPGPSVDVTPSLAITASPTRPATASPVATKTPAPSPNRAATATSTFVRVNVGEYFFDPQVVTITVGTKVVWVPTGDRPHTIVSVDTDPAWGGSVGDAGSPPFEFAFARPGVYSYTCDIHSGVMDGYIVVIGGD